MPRECSSMDSAGRSQALCPVFRATWGSRSRGSLPAAALPTGSRHIPGESCLGIAAESSSAVRSHCQRLLFSAIPPLCPPPPRPPWLFLLTVELVLFFFNSWGMPDRTWVCRQEPKVQYIGFLRPERRAKSSAVGTVARDGVRFAAFPKLVWFWNTLEHQLTPPSNSSVQWNAFRKVLF